MTQQVEVARNISGMDQSSPAAAPLAMAGTNAATDSLWIRIENAASFFILDLKERKAEQKKGRRRVKCNNVSYCRQRRGQNKRQQEQKNNTRDSNVVPHRSTNLARQCLTSLSRREAVLSLWYGRSCRIGTLQTVETALYMYSVYSM